MDNEKNKIPSWLQDKKKLLIIVIIIISMIISFANQAILGSKVKSFVLSKLDDIGIHIEIGDILKAEIAQLYTRNLRGTYHNDYAEETLTFKRGGKFEYTAAGYTTEGTFTVDANQLTLYMNLNEFNFDILKADGKTLVISTGKSMFSYTKVK